jgi:prepilin-type N-terminal cleavage/methylation domain-containing protein
MSASPLPPGESVLRSSKGFTLVEVMTATALIGLVLVALMQIVPGMLKVGTKVEVITKATFLAEKKMEEIHSLINSSYSVNRTQSAAAFSSPNSLYKFTVSDDGGANIKIINVTVWNDDDGDNTIDSNEYSVSFDTKVANRS